MGLRSSCEASEIRRRCRVWPSSSRTSIAFIVRARRAISSSPEGSGTRRWSSAAEIAATSRRIASTGASARPTPAHVVTPTMISRTGTAASSTFMIAAELSRTESRLRPTSTMSGSPAGRTASATTTSGSSSSSEIPSMIRLWPPRRSAIGGSSRNRGVDASTTPAPSTTCIRTSSSSAICSDSGVVPRARSKATSCARSCAALLESLSSACCVIATRASDAPISATPTTRTAPAVARARTDRSATRSRDQRVPSAATSVQSIAGTPNGLQCLAAERTVQLVAQMQDVHLDDVGIAFEVVVPHVVEDLPLRQDVPLAAEQELQDRELAPGELDLRLTTPAAARRGGAPQVARHQHRRTLPCAAPQERAEACKQDEVGERLRQVVVGSAVQRLRLVHLAVPGGQHQDRGPVPFLPEGRADLEPVDAWQHDVEHYRVVRPFPSYREPLDAVHGVVDGEPLGLQASLQPGGQALLVLHDKNSHAAPRSIVRELR